MPSILLPPLLETGFRGNPSPFTLCHFDFDTIFGCFPNQRRMLIQVSSRNAVQSVETLSPVAGSSLGEFLIVRYREAGSIESPTPPYPPFPTSRLTSFTVFASFHSIIGPHRFVSTNKMGNSQSSSKLNEPAVEKLLVQQLQAL